MKVVSLENLSKYNELLNQKTVRSVNSVQPDSNGNVTIEAGKVKSVNNIQPDDSGDVTLEIPQAIGVTRFPDYEHPITVFDVVNKGFIQDVNFDYVFPEDGYFHYRLLAAEGKYYDAIIAGSLTVNGNVVDLYERSRSPSGSGLSSCINGLIPVPKGSALHIGFLQCDAEANNVIEFFPLKNGNAIQADEVTGVVKSVNSIAPDESGNVQLDIDTSELENQIAQLDSTTVKSVNQVAPDSNGNVQLGTEKSTFNKVVYDTGYFSIAASNTYNFDLTGSDLENVSKENVNIRLIAKVTTAHNGFQVGDIAQLSLGLNSGDSSGGSQGICSFIRDNTLYLCSTSSLYLSVYSPVPSAGWLEKTKVQLKAVLTAFVPDDGSILLIAEDQTNTSKLIGLPDGTLTWSDKNISLLSPVHYSRSSNFETSGRTSIKLPSYLSLMVNGSCFRNDTEVTVDISDSANWDSTETDYTVAENRAGKDFYIYAVDDKVTKSVHIVLSANSTVPTGYTESSSRKIGGFHCLCLSVGAIPGHTLSGYVTGDILPNSVWDLLHRAVSENEGMVYDEGIDKWVAIYLPSWDGSKLVSVYGGTIVDGTSSMPMHGELFDEYASEVGCKLPSRSEFMSFSKGSNQGTNISNSADPNTTGGHTDTNGRRMISNIGVEDCCGVLWQWSSDCFESLASAAYDLASGNATVWSNSPSWYRNSTTTASSHYYLNGYTWFKEPVYNPNVSSDSDKGSCRGLLRRALLGGSWGDSSYCGSRCVYCSFFGSAVSGSVSARLVSGARIVNL